MKNPRYRPLALALLAATLSAAHAQAPPDVTDLLRMLVSGAPGAPVPDAEPPVRPPPDQASVTSSNGGLLDLHVRDTDLAIVLEMLSYEAQANIVATRSVSGQVSANLYAVTLEEALQALLAPNGFATYVADKTIFVGTPEEIAGFQPPPETRVFRLRFLQPEEAATAVRAVLSPTGAVLAGGAVTGESKQSDDEFVMGGSSQDYLLITDRPAYLEAAGELLAALDVRPPQVLIESTVLRATLNENNQFGIDFTVLGGVDFENVNSVSNASSNLTTGLLPREFFQETTLNVNTAFNPNFSGGFTFGIINNGVATFIRALEEVTDVVVVANPKIIALNKQEAGVIVGRRDGYLTTTVTETAAVQTVEFLETGTQIRFRPIVNPDGTVRLAVHPKDSNGGLTVANLPFEETTEADADVLVQDGHTVLIGGLFRERNVHSKSQLPLLGNLPGAGLLFGSQSSRTVREEVIILLTVHVLKDTPAAREEFAGLLEDVERIRVGSRMGLFAIGRERLAQAHYQEAVRQLECGNRGLALLNARMALHNQPKHLPAFKLRERLLDERTWDEDGGRMRTFIWDLIGAPPPAADPVAPHRFGRPMIGPELLRPEDDPPGPREVAP